MNITRPTSKRLCKCGQQFELVSRGLRYCPTCREARPAADAARKEQVRQRVCSCGQPFTAETGHQRTCPICLAARKAAEDAKPPRKCKKCGQIKHGVKSTWCPAYWDASRADRHANYGRTLTAQTSKPASTGEYLSSSEILGLALDLAATLVRFAREHSKGKTAQPFVEEEVLPEWVDADNQEVIDQVASELLADVEM